MAHGAPEGQVGQACGGGRLRPWSFGGVPRGAQWSQWILLGRVGPQKGSFGPKLTGARGPPLGGPGIPWRERSSPPLRGAAWPTASPPVPWGPRTPRRARASAPCGACALWDHTPYGCTAHGTLGGEGRNRFPRKQTISEREGII